jgi:hypothetical protein
LAENQSEPGLRHTAVGESGPLGNHTIAVRQRGRPWSSRQTAEADADDREVGGLLKAIAQRAAGKEGIVGAVRVDHVPGRRADGTRSVCLRRGPSRKSPAAVVGKVGHHYVGCH